MKTNTNKTLIIWILGALSTVTPFAIDLYLPAFSEIANDFNTSVAKVSLSVSSYFVGMALGQIIYGPLLDRFGRKKPLYVGLVIFIMACIGCTFSSTINELVIFRFVQAIGGSVAWVAAVAMVRDFFEVKESARLFSILILIIGVSPLIAPTLGGFIAIWLGWKAIFILLAIIVSVITLVTYLFLPAGNPPDLSVSLKPKPMIFTFFSILKNPQFYTYTFAGAFAFATLFIYVAGSPMVFLDLYKVSPTVYGGIFAFLSVGFIGGSQLNIYLNKKYNSETLFQFFITCQVINSALFLLFAWLGWLGLFGHIFFFFTALSCVGIINPNSNALALAPFTRNVGSASALLGCSQIGIAALASSGVGALGTTNTIPIISLFLLTSFIGLVIHFFGKIQVEKNVLEVDVQ